MLATCGGLQSVNTWPAGVSWLGLKSFESRPRSRAAGSGILACSMTATWLPNEICPPLPVKFLLFALLLAAGAHGTGLDEIRATQQKLLGARDGGKPLRDEVPLEAVALVKRQLLSWLESRLAAFGHDSEIENLTLVLSGELHAALTPTQDDQDRLGEMEVSFSHPAGEPGWLQMSTDIGIPCGVDQSVYL